jgi:NADH:ubiquinone oxidoreductase subunit 6 (subunit J)
MVIPMNKKIAIGVCVSAMLLTVLVASVMVTEWDDYVTNESPEGIDFTGVVDENGDMDQNSLNYALFEKFGPLLLILAVLMFGAMIGGVCIAREEVDRDDSD